MAISTVGMPRNINILPTGNFFSDEGGRLQKASDRFFLGTAANQDGARVPAQRTWVGSDEANGLFTYLETRSTFFNISTIGGVTYAGATKVSDNPSGMTNASIVYAALAKNDIIDATASNRRATWGFYGVAYRAPDDGSAIAGAAEVAEFQIANAGGIIDTNPYVSRSMTSGVTYAAILGSGGEYAESGQTINHASAALHISGGNGAKFRKGINISSAALDGTDGSTGVGDAITMAKGHQLVWFWSGADNSRGLTIRSDCNSSTHAMKIVGTNQGLRIYDQADNTMLQVNATGAGFFGATPVAKQTLSAALSTGGSETNTNIATAINAIRTALINYGLAA